MKDDEGFTPKDQAESSKAESMEQVDAAADEGWKELIIDIVCDLGDTMELLTTDEVCIQYRTIPAAGRPNTHNWKALGPRMQAAAKLGYIEKTTMFRKSTDGPRRHGAPLQVWRSLILGWKNKP